MNAKYLRNLELDKVVAMAAEYAVCPETKRRLAEELPYTEAGDVRLLLGQTDALATLLVKNGSPRISQSEGAVSAVSRAEKGGILSMGELLLVARALRNFSVLASWYARDDDAPALPVDDLFYTITPQPALEKGIPEAILSEEEMADTASDTLYQLRRKIRTAENAIRDKLDAVVKNQNNSRFLQDAIVSLRNGRFVVPVKAEYRNEIGGVIHDVSSSGATLFVEPTAVVEGNAKILQLRNQEQQEIERILMDFSARVAEMAPLFYPAYEAVLEIDKRLAKAQLGLAQRGVRPGVNEEMCFSLVKARHPLLDPANVVPVDIELGKSYDTLIITGPNTGGKTVSLKTAGLLCAMAQLGYLIPAHDESSVCVFQHLLVDIGDEQSIEQSLSTFSGHIQNIQDILKVANARSLVLLDELGAGTDPAEGAALAIAIIETLRTTGARTMATTHYAELKLFALDTQGVQNAGSEFNVDTLRPTYRLVVGVPGRSNAFLIGERLGLPQTVLEGARSHLSSEQQRFETVLTQLEDSKKELAQREAEVAQLRDVAGHQLRDAQQKRDALIQQGEKQLESARAEAGRLADEVEEAAYGLLDEIKRLEKDKRLSNAQKAQRARQILKQESKGLQQKSSAGYAPKQTNFTPLSHVQTGQEVYLPDLGKNATVLATPDKAGLVELRMGAAKTKVPLMQLSQPPKAPPQAAKPSRYAPAGSGKTSAPAPRTPKSELNLLGKTVDEALMETDQFLDNALTSNLQTVYIIHGRGTGALRSAIQQHLRGNKAIKSYRLGTYGEGEDGVTVVEL